MLDLVPWPAGLVIALAACVVGCQRGTGEAETAPAASPSTIAQAFVPEVSLAEQVAQVRAGKSVEVRLERTAISSTDLAQLAQLTELRTLILDAGRVRDEDVHLLAGLSGLEHLRLRESPLSDVGLAELSRCGLASLVILNVPQATPTAAGLKELRRLPRVRQLRIAGKQIDDAAVKELAEWPELTSIHLIGPSLSDRSLETIASMTELASFYLDDCPLSDAAWERLFRARPTLHVHIDQFHHDHDPNTNATH